MYVSEFSAWVSIARQRYSFVKQLLEASVNDPVSNPYRSKYAAKDLLASLLNDILTKWNTIDMLQVRLLRSLFKFETGKICLETEELSEGCEILTATMEEIKDIAETSECCYLAVNALNHLGIIWSERGDFIQALGYLSQAEQLFNSFKERNTLSPYISEDFFTLENVNEKNLEEFEKLHTLTLYYLAQVHGHLSNSDDSAKYLWHTLKRQKESENYETEDWVTNCAKLSEYFINVKSFVEARHLVSCARLVLDEFEEAKKDDEQILESLKSVKASLAFCLLKLCISLISDSAGTNKTSADEKFPTLLHDERLAALEGELPFPVDNFEKASVAFRYGQKQAALAKEYYTLDSFASNYANITMDQSKLYKAVIAHENDNSRMCKMHKRRMDLLDDLLKKLNPQHFLAICKQLQFELGEIALEMFNLKRDAVKAGCNNVAAIVKINSLVTKTVGYNEAYISSFRDKKGELPKTYPDDEVRSVLLAHFHIGSMQSKFIEADKEKKLENYRTMEKYFKYIVRYLADNPAHMPYIEAELNAIEDMLELMPDKIRMLQMSY